MSRFITITTEHEVPEEVYVHAMEIGFKNLAYEYGLTPPRYSVPCLRDEWAQVTRLPSKHCGLYWAWLNRYLYREGLK